MLILLRTKPRRIVRIGIIRLLLMKHHHHHITATIILPLSGQRITCQLLLATKKESIKNLTQEGRPPDDTDYTVLEKGNADRDLCPLYHGD